MLLHRDLQRLAYHSKAHRQHEMNELTESQTASAKGETLKLYNFVAPSTLRSRRTMSSAARSSVPPF
jgi:hypothetical protein